MSERCEFCGKFGARRRVFDRGSNGHGGRDLLTFTKRPPDHYTVHVRRKVKAGDVSYETALYRVTRQNAGTPIYLGCTERWWVFACPNQ